MGRCGTPYDSGDGSGAGTGSGPQARTGSPANRVPGFAGVATLRPCDDARIDLDSLSRLVVQAGSESAEDAVCRALEDLIHRLQQSERAHRACDFARLRTQALAIAEIAVRLGAVDLAASAGHVVACTRGADGVALSATLGRMLRLGWRTLTKIARTDRPSP